MGAHLKYEVEDPRDQEATRRFTRHLIQDVLALEHMLAEGLLETGIRRIGAEQELFLVDDRFQPAPVAEQVLADTRGCPVVSELTRFNLEFNMDPLEFGGSCLRAMEDALNALLQDVRALLARYGVHPVMAGILPTIHLSDLVIDNMTPNPRYYALNDAIARLRGGPGTFQIRGVDELFVKHDSIMLEGCNTSFQTHFQVAPDEFARLYNIAQAVAGPVLAASSNSPLLFGKRLWRETRIALFQQAVDTRSSNLYLREMSPRVHFGTGWVRDSVTEIFKEDIARFRVLITADTDEDPFEVLRGGGAPRLTALQLHNGTVYRWNRACYGVYQGKPHLRIENRILPAGPSIADEIANAALWFGLVSGLAHQDANPPRLMSFDDARSNFGAAARFGLASSINWFHQKRFAAQDLILQELLPLARWGLTHGGIDPSDVDRYLGIVEERVKSKRTGAQWQLESFAATAEKGTRAERLSSIVRAMLERQQTGEPGHTWPLAEFHHSTSLDRLRSSRVEHFMTTDLFTVHEDELVEFVAYLMDWRKIRHVLVEDDRHKLVGLVSHRTLLRFLADPLHAERRSSAPVRDVMRRDPIAVAPETTTMEAVRIMRQHRIGSLPIVREGQLVGIVTESDFMDIAGKLLDDSA